MLHQLSHLDPKPECDGDGWPLERALGPFGEDVLAFLDSGPLWAPVCKRGRAVTWAKLQGLSDRRRPGAGAAGESERKWIRGLKWSWIMWPPGYSSFRPSEIGRAEQGWVDRGTGLDPSLGSLQSASGGKVGRRNKPEARTKVALCSPPFLPGRKQVLPGTRPLGIVLAPPGPRLQIPEASHPAVTPWSRFVPSSSESTVACPRSRAIHSHSRVATTSSSSL